MSEVAVAALYRFVAFDDPAALRGPLARACAEAEVRGTLLLAREGVNGTIAGSSEGVAAVIAHLRRLPGCADLDVKISHAATMPFARMKVRLKREIVTLGRPEADPTRIGRRLCRGARLERGDRPAGRGADRYAQRL